MYTTITHSAWLQFQWWDAHPTGSAHRDDSCDAETPAEDATRTAPELIMPQFIQ